MTYEELIKHSDGNYTGDSVDHPDHYNLGGIECIDAMIAAFGESAVQNFCLCNAFKYIWRYKLKNGAEDVKKAGWYVNKWLEIEESIEEGL